MMYSFWQDPIKFACKYLENLASLIPEPLANIVPNFKKRKIDYCRITDESV